MKKKWNAFCAVMILGICAQAALTVRAAKISLWLSAASAAVFVLAAAYFWARFRSIEYIRDGERLVIRSGVLIKTEKIILNSRVLWKSTVTLCGVFMFSVLHTASGRAAVFAPLDKYQT